MILKKGVFLVLLLLIVGCKTEKKEKTIEIVSTPIEKTESPFEKKLLDLRNVNKKFIDGFVVEKFGMQKIKDSIYTFVFKLNDSINEQTLNKYSIGIKGFDSDLKKDYRSSFSPNLKIIEGNKYIVQRRKLINIKHFDSIDVYIYERKNFKKSGRLGEIKIRNILFEE